MGILDPLQLCGKKSVINSMTNADLGPTQRVTPAAAKCGPVNRVQILACRADLLRQPEVLRVLAN